METIKIKRITTKQINSYIEKLFKKIVASQEQFTRVVGIERGGLNISIPLAQKLNLPHSGIKISFYPEGNHIPLAEPNVNMHGVKFRKRDRILFVDDLTDSGSTIKYLKENFDYEFKTAVLYWNAKSTFTIKPDFYVQKKPDYWLIFPWEENENS